MRVFGALLLAVALTPAVTFAHGGIPQSQQVLRQGDTIVVNATFGVVVSEDAGATWSWICPEAIPSFRRGFTTPAVLVDETTMFMASFSGLLRGDSLGCDWVFHPVALEGVFVADVIADPSTPGALIALPSAPDSENPLYRSTDSGASWGALAGVTPSGFLPERVRVAPSDGTRIYVSGAFPAMPMVDRAAAVFRSDDGGASFMRFDFTLEMEEIDLILLEVDPTTPDHVWAWVRGEVHDRLVESTDGGATFTTIARIDAAPVPIGRPFAFVPAADGFLWFGNSEFGLVRTVDGTTVEDIDKELDLACLHRFGDDVWACGNGTDDLFSVASTTAADQPFNPILEFDDIRTIRACGAGSDVPMTCAEWLDDLDVDLLRATDGGVGEDGGVVPVDAAGIDGGAGFRDAGPGVDPPDDGGGCCSTTGAVDGYGPLSAAALLLFALSARRSRRRRGRGRTARARCRADCR